MQRNKKKDINRLINYELNKQINEYACINIIL